MHFSFKRLPILTIDKMDPTEKTTIEQRLVETGEKERLKEHLRNRLIESGWREELKLEAKKVNKETEWRFLSSNLQHPLASHVAGCG